MDQKFLIERGVIDLVCSSRCTIISLMMVLSGQNAFWAGGEFMLQYREWPLSKVESKAEQLRCIHFYIIHLCLCVDHSLLG